MKSKEEKIARIIELEKEIERIIRKANIKKRNVEEAEQEIKDKTAHIATWNKQIEEAEKSLPKVQEFYEKKSKDLIKFLEENDLTINSDGEIVLDQ